MLLLVCLRARSQFCFLDLYTGCYVRLTSVYSPKSNPAFRVVLFFFKQITCHTKLQKGGIRIILSCGRVSCFRGPVALGASNVPFLKTVYGIILRENELSWTVRWRESEVLEIRWEWSRANQGKQGARKYSNARTNRRGTLKEKAAQTLRANSPRRIGKQRIEKRSCLSDG